MREGFNLRGEADADEGADELLGLHVGVCS